MSKSSTFAITIFTQPLHTGRMTQCQFFKWSLTGLNSEFSFSKTSWRIKVEENSLPYYLPIAGGRIIGFIPFPRVLVLWEMQSVSSRIWTRIPKTTTITPRAPTNYTTGTCRLAKTSHELPSTQGNCGSKEELRPVGRQHCWGRFESWGESWRTEKTYCHLNSRLLVNLCAYYIDSVTYMLAYVHFRIYFVR